MVKKLLKILKWTAAGILLLLLLSYLALRTSWAQTFITQKISHSIASKLHTRIEVGGVDIEFFTKVVLEDVYVEDLHQDTLLYAKKIKLDIGSFSYSKKNIFLKDILLQGSKINLKKYRQDTVMNLRFIVDYFAPKDTAKKDTTGWKVGYGGITLDDVSFRLKDEHDTSRTTAMNFSDLKVSGLHAKFSELKFDVDTIRTHIEYLNFKEKSGFEMKDMSAAVKVSPAGINLNGLLLKTANSYMETDLAFSTRSLDDFNDLENKVKLKAEFKGAKINLKDIGYFSSSLAGADKEIILTGDLSGKISELRGKDMQIVFGGSSHYYGDFDITGLPDIDETFMHFNIRELAATRRDLMQIPAPPFSEGKKLFIPENIGLLGLAKFKGSFTGYYYDFTAYGKLFSALGGVSMDVSLKQDPGTKVESYSGKIRSEEFDIGRFLSVSSMGKVSMDAQVDGTGLRKENANARLKGTISSLDFNGYRYHNVDLEGTLAKKVFNGKLKVEEENADLAFDGSVDFSKSPVTLDFISQVSKLNFAALHFVKSDKFMSIASVIHINLKGDNIDNVTGIVQFNDTYYAQGKELYPLKNFDLRINEVNNVKSVRLESDFADASLSGKITVSELPASLGTFALNFIPTLRKEKEKKKKAAGRTEQDFIYTIQLKKTDAVTGIFLPSAKLSPGGKITGRFSSSANDFSLTGSIPGMELSGNRMKNVNIDSYSTKDKLSLHITSSRFSVSDSSSFDNINFSAEAAKDTVHLNLAWDNNSSPQFYATLPAYISFSEKPRIKIHLLDSKLMINDSLWTVSPGNEIIIDTASYAVKDLAFHYHDQLVKIEGAVSHKREDQLYVILNGFNLKNFNVLAQRSGLTINGFISGNASVANIMEPNPLFSSSLDFKTLKINNEDFGSGTVVSIWDKRKDAISLNGSLSRGIVPNISFSGYYYPNKTSDNLDMDAELTNFRMIFFEPYLKSVFSTFRGQLSGKVSVKGNLNQPKINGYAVVQAKNLHVDYLGMTYNIPSDTIWIEPNSFGLRNVKLYADGYKTPAIINGKVYHNNFKNFQVDFDILADKFICMRTTARDNNLFYGKAFLSGTINIFGFTDDVIYIDAVVKTEKVLNMKGEKELTEVHIPLSGPSEVSEADYITFVKKGEKPEKTKDYRVQLSGLVLNFQLEMTPDAKVELIFDEKVGDVISGTGSGNLKMEINTHGSFGMYGDYLIEDGSYLFTLKNVINKKFRIEKGSLIKWSGDAYNADVDLSAIYSLRTSLTPLFPPSVYPTGDYSKRYPVDCKLIMRGKLLQPDLSFDVALPTVDDNTKQTVKNLLNTEQEMNKQVFALLMLGSFVVPPEYSAYKTDNPTAGTTGASTGSELLSNQLSNWLSQISKEFDVGVHYRPGDQLTSDEVQLALSTQLLNDRLSIEGSVGNNTSAATRVENSSNVVGDANVEYKVSSDGKLRVKAFNKANDNNITNPNAGTYTQGVGVSYKQEFETIGELYRRYLGWMGGAKKKKT